MIASIAARTAQLIFQLTPINLSIERVALISHPGNCQRSHPLLGTRKYIPPRTKWVQGNFNFY